MTTALLLVVQGRPPGKRLLFPDGDYYIGRGAECHVRPDSDWVSRQHCLFRVTDGGVFLRDLGSRNGTLVNGRLLSGETRLDHADRIQIGPLVFEVRLEAMDTAPRSAAEEGIETVPVAPKRPADAPRAPPTKFMADATEDQLIPKRPEEAPPAPPTEPSEKPAPPAQR